VCRYDLVDRRFTGGRHREEMAEELVGAVDQVELVSHRIGLVGGLFYGLNFGMGGIAAAILGGMSDRICLEMVYLLCSFLPLVGLLTLFLPRITDDRTTPSGKG
jgi:hypothetical protein